MTTAQWSRWKLGDRELNKATERELSLALVRHWLESPWFFIRNFCYTVAKDTSEVLIDPFIGQTMLFYSIEVQRRLGYAQRVIEIKPRQVGWTTINLAYGFWKMFHPRHRVTGLVPDDEVVADLMMKVNTFYNGLPSAMVPMKRIDNKNLLVFDNPDPRSREKNRGFASQFNIATPSAQRGKTPNTLFIIEAAHMPEFEEILEAMVNAMPIDDSSCVVIDTTPAGFDERYYPMVCEAVENNPKWVAKWERDTIPSREEVLQGILGLPDNLLGWIPVFMPWFWHEQYTSKDEDPRGQLPALTDEQRTWVLQTLGKLEQYGDEREEELHRKYGVSIGRLAWRRFKLDTSGSPDIQERLLVFDQEFASTWHSCFVEYNHSPFDKRGMDMLMRGGRQPLARGMIREDNKGFPYIDTQWLGGHDEFRIYGWPEEGERYTMGVDTNNAYESMTADDTWAVVVRRRDDKVVAIYQGKAPPHIIRDRVALLYEFYHRPYLAIETEGVGYSLPRQLFDMGVRNQYFWKRIDQDVPKVTDYLGFETNHKTRPDMENLLIELIGWRTDGRPDPQVIVQDIPLLRQLSTLKRNPDGKIKGQGRSHDDGALALMIALYASRDPWGTSYKSPILRPDDIEVKAENPLMSRYLRSSSGGSRNRPTFESL